MKGIRVGNRKRTNSKEEFINFERFNKVEQCWVIQRDDGKYFDYIDMGGKTHFCNDISSSFDFSVNLYKQDNKLKYSIEEKIRDLNLQNCKPVKIEIRVVGE